MFKIFMKRSHRPFDCPIAGFYFRVAFTVLNASSLHMRVPNQQRAPRETPWGGSTAATVSALSPTHVRRERPVEYLDQCEASCLLNTYKSAQNENSEKARHYSIFYRFEM